MARVPPPRVRIGGVRYGRPDQDFGDDGTVDERRRRLRDLVPVAGTRFEYPFDFGDGWEVDIEVEAIQPWRSRTRHPILLDGARAAPPEDVGGPWGYEHFLEVIADSSHEEHEQLLDWVGGEFDPDWLDVHGINEALEFEFGGTRR